MSRAALAYPRVRRGTAPVSCPFSVTRQQGEEEVELELDLTGLYILPHGGSWNEPPGGNYVEDVIATLDGKDFHLTDDELADAEQALMEAYEHG